MPASRASHRPTRRGARRLRSRATARNQTLGAAAPRAHGESRQPSLPDPAATRLAADIEASLAARRAPRAAPCAMTVRPSGPMAATAPASWLPRRDRRLLRRRRGCHRAPASCSQSRVARSRELLAPEFTRTTRSANRRIQRDCIIGLDRQCDIDAFETRIACSAPPRKIVDDSAAVKTAAARNDEGVCCCTFVTLCPSSTTHLPHAANLARHASCATGSL